MKRGSWRIVTVVFWIVVIAREGTAPVRTAPQDPAARPCNEPAPAGFTSFDHHTGDFWAGPWVFETRGAVSTPLAALDNSSGQQTNGPIRLRLDDASDGTLRIESRPCRPADDCEPDDCGCPLERESYWIEVLNARGVVVARMHLWAAYGIFQIIPVDLIDGPGDELMIVRVPAHSSPPIGYDLKIWKIGQTKPTVLGGQDRVAKLLGSYPIGCARWRTLLSVATGAKPRPITLRTEFGAAPCCRIVDEEAALIRNLRQGQVLRFDADQGKYVFP